MNPIRMIPRVAVVALVAGSAVAAGPLELESVTLYRSGVGSFEWRGVVDGDAEMSISFDKDAMPDILKSMILLDAGGGRIEAVRYDADEPLERRLDGFGVDLGTGSFESIFVALRGAEVKLERERFGLSVEGRVVGIGRRATGEGQRGGGVQYVTIATDTGVRSVDFATIASFTILDEQLADRVNGAIVARSASRDERSAGVDLRFSGDGVRPVIVGYVHEAPIWKTSYRLVLPKDSGSEATLQGWAIVENTTDSDWTDVALTLVSGRPVGFTMDLYEPLYLDRPDVPVPVESAASPRVYEGDLDNGVSPSRATAGRGGRAFAEESEAMTMDRARSGLPEGALARMAAPPPAATASERGELFVFDLDDPVTIERRRSAMIPLLTSDLPARRVSVYNENDLAAHPMRGVEIRNDSGLKLMPGPVTVYDAGAFAGDAQIGSLAKGESRLLAHAVDLDVLATTERRDVREMSTASIRSRALRRTYTQRSTTSYTFTNRADARRTIIVEASKRPGWDLASPAKNVTETPSSYRFEIDAAAGKDATLDVVFTRVVSDRVTLTDRPIEVLARELANDRVSRDFLDALQRAAELQRALDDARARVQRLDDEAERLAAEQDRLRQNLEAVGSGGDLGRRYLASLASSEDRLDEVRSQRRAAERAVDEAEAELEAYLDGLSIDWKAAGR